MLGKRDKILFCGVVLVRFTEVIVLFYSDASSNTYVDLLDRESFLLFDPGRHFLLRIWKAGSKVGEVLP